MRYIEALDEFDGNSRAIFLAGGISNCSDWQSEMVNLLSDTDLTIINPRRKNFPIDDPSQSKTQIEWEYRHLRKVQARLFWFPCETLCPITLFELGVWSAGVAEPLFVGTHPDYREN